jgi:hypothetical protein
LYFKNWFYALNFRNLKAILGFDKNPQNSSLSIDNLSMDIP